LEAKLRHFPNGIILIPRQPTISNSHYQANNSEEVPQVIVSKHACKYPTPTECKQNFLQIPVDCWTTVAATPVLP